MGWNSKSRESNPATSQAYKHKDLMEEFDNMNRKLQEMKDKLIKDSVQCHILDMELATLAAPDVVAALRSAKQECERCTETVKNLTESAEAVLSN